MSLRFLHYSDLENAYDRPGRVARLAGLVDSLRDETTVVAGSGDNTGPGVLALTEDGRQSLDFFGAVEPAVDTPGNHDFDHGYDGLRSIVADSPQTWVVANAKLEGNRFGEAVGIRPWTIVERDDYRVGVTGVTTPATPEITPPAADLTVSDPVDAVADAVESLRERSVDVVAVLAHLADDEAIARRCDVDVILGGHVHSERAERVDGTVLTRPDAGGSYLYEVLIDGEETSVRRHEVADAPVDEGVAAALRDRTRRAGLDDPVGTVDRPIERTDEVTLHGECRIGNFVADAYRWATGADIGLQNAGGIRDGEPLAGTVTAADLVGIVPFEEPTVTAELSGAELRELCCEASGRRVGPGDADWWNAHFSGIEIIWDRTTDSLVSARVDGDPLDPAARYTLATSAYLAETDYEFPSLDAEHVVAEGPVQYDVLVEYARETGISPSVDGRIRWHDGGGSVPSRQLADDE